MFQENPYFSQAVAEVAPVSENDRLMPLVMAGIAVLLIVSVLSGVLRRLNGNARPGRQHPRGDGTPRQTATGSSKAFDMNAWRAGLPGSEAEAPATAGQTDPTALRNPARQLEAIARVDFERRPLLNKAEARILPVIERTLKDLALGHRVMAQTSMGEILRPVPASGTNWLLSRHYFQ